MINLIISVSRYILLALGRAISQWVLQQTTTPYLLCYSGGKHEFGIK